MVKYEELISNQERIIHEIWLVINNNKEKLSQHGLNLQSKHENYLKIDIDKTKFKEDSKVIKLDMNEILLTILAPYPVFDFVLYIICKNKTITQTIDSVFPVSNFLKEIFNCVEIKYYDHDYCNIKVDEDMDNILNNIKNYDNFENYEKNIKLLKSFKILMKNNFKIVNETRVKLLTNEEEYGNIIIEEKEEMEKEINIQNKEKTLSENIHDIQEKINKFLNNNKKELENSEMEKKYICLKNVIDENFKKDETSNSLSCLSKIRERKKNIENDTIKNYNYFKNINNNITLLNENFIKEIINIENILFPETFNITTDKIEENKNFELFKNKYITLICSVKFDFEFCEKFQMEEETFRELVNSF